MLTISLTEVRDNLNQLVYSLAIEVSHNKLNGSIKNSLSPKLVTM